MTTLPELEAREPLPPELLDRIRETVQLAILAGCTAEEVVALCKETVSAWTCKTGWRPCLNPRDGRY